MMIHGGEWRLPEIPDELRDILFSLTGFHAGDGCHQTYLTGL
jgi:hypothetical protein